MMELLRKAQSILLIIAIVISMFAAIPTLASAEEITDIADEEQKPVYQHYLEATPH